MPKVKLQRKNHVSAQYIQPKLPTIQTIEHCAGIFFIKIGPIHNGGEKTETSFRQVQFWKKTILPNCVFMTESLMLIMQSQ